VFPLRSQNGALDGIQILATKRLASGQSAFYLGFYDLARSCPKLLH